MSVIVVGLVLGIAQAPSCISGVAPPGALTREDSEAHLFALCQDREDNDRDGLTDCADPDCGVFLVCDGASGGDVEGGDGDGADAPDAAGPDVAGPDATTWACNVHAACDPGRGVLCRSGRCEVPPDYTVPPAEETFDAMGMVRPAALTVPSAPVGAVVGTLCGVEAREHGPGREAFDHESPYGFAFQSNELAYRYLCRFGADSAWSITSLQTAFSFRCRLDAVSGAVAPRLRADRWYDAIDDPTLGLLERYPSGGFEPPRPGDVVAFDVAPHGHLAVVEQVLLNDRYGLVEVLEQGPWGSTHRYRVDVSMDGRYSVPSARGWLRVPGAPPACGVAGRLDPVQVVRDPTGRDLLVVGVEVEASSPVRVARLWLRDEDGVVRLTRDYAGYPLEVSFTASLDLVASGITEGEHRLTLEVEPAALERSFTLPIATARYRYGVGAAAHPYAAQFEAAAASYGVPACLLAAIADVNSGWWQGARSSTGAVGIMGIAAADVAEAAELVGLPDLPDLTGAALAADDDAGAAANIRAAAALLARWAGGDVGAPGRMAPGDPAAALESWWPAVARFGGAGVDHDYATSAFAYRVFNRLAQGVPGRVPRIAGLDVAVLAPVVAARPATPEELAVGDALPGDAALAPVTGPLYLRRAAPVAAADLPAAHTCAGSCASADCASAVCAPEVAQVCGDGELVWRDSCGGLGAVVDPCAGSGAACAMATCAAGRCVSFSAPDGLACGDLRVCSAGWCRAPDDADGDGYYLDREPLDCPGHDDDPLINPGQAEVLDVRDNDCDGLSDVVGDVRLDRYRKEWSPADWEHRYSATPITLPGWTKEERWLGVYPLDVCDSPDGPLDGCTYKKNDSEIELWGDFVLVGLVQCTGVYADSGKHITLLLEEDGGEYGEYHQSPYFTCTRLGYVPGVAAVAVMPSLKPVYRHRAGFDSGVSDNMWSIWPDDGEPHYDVHGLTFHALDGG